jgi:hypothetical protein
MGKLKNSVVQMTDQDGEESKKGQFWLTKNTSWCVFLYHKIILEKLLLLFYGQLFIYLTNIAEELFKTLRNNRVELKEMEDHL